MKKRFAAQAVLLIILASFLLSSCGIIIINTPGSETSNALDVTSEIVSTTDSTSDTTTNNYEKYVSPEYEKQSMEELKSLPDADMGSRSVFLASVTETGSFFDEDGETVSASVYRRNRAVEQKFGVLILSINENLETVRENMRKAQKSKDLYTDIAIIPQRCVGEFNSSGLLGNIRMLPYFSENYVGIDKEATSQLSFGGKLYGVIGNATKNPEKTTVVFVNTTLSKEACAEISHNDMMSGGFTIEKLAEASKLSRISVDADALPDVYTSLYFSEGGYYTSDNKTLSYSSFANDIVSNISALRKSFSTDYSDGQDKTSGFDVFSHGNSLFAISTLDRAAELGTCGFMWDFFPLPKLDDSQDDYVSVMSFDAPVMTVSTFTNNIDAMSYTMNGLNAASYGFIAQEYGEYLQNNFVTSSQTLDSFDLIYSLSVKYDTAVMFRSVSSVKAATEDSLESSILTGSAFVSESKKYMSKYNSALKGLN